MEEDDIHHHHHTPTFKSIVSNITSFEDLNYYMGEAIKFQGTFDKSTTPWEQQEEIWPGDTLQKFKIDLQKIDRVYHIDYYDTAIYGGREYELIARMNYKDKPLYVYLKAECEYTRFDSEGVGYIYLSYDADTFMKTVLTDYRNVDPIYDLLLTDGIYVER